MSDGVRKRGHSNRSLAPVEEGGRESAGEGVQLTRPHRLRLSSGGGFTPAGAFVWVLGAAGSGGGASGRRHQMRAAGCVVATTPVGATPAALTRTRTVGWDGHGVAHSQHHLMQLELRLRR
jgi:hypothetical protein